MTSLKWKEVRRNKREHIMQKDVIHTKRDVFVPHSPGVAKWTWRLALNL